MNLPVARLVTLANTQSRAAIVPDDISFVICVEGNVLGSQALLLCESLRRFGGEYRDCPIWAVSPRPEMPPADDVVAALIRLNVAVHRVPLNRTGSSYGPINRVVSAAWAETRIATPYLCVLDSDTVFLRAPQFVQADAGVRPVDTKGSASSGPADPKDAYWAQICASAGIAIDRLPVLRTTVCKTPIRSSYNGGFLVSKVALGINQLTERVFIDSFQRNLRPLPAAIGGFIASSGRVDAEAASWWGSTQAALSAAISARTDDIYLYDNEYNIPLHLFATQKDDLPFQPKNPVLVHYHHLAAEPHRADFLENLQRIGCAPEVCDWIAASCAGLDWTLAP